MYDFKDKAANINQNNRYMFAKTISMFEYQNLPETIPYQELEKILQTSGYAFITEVKGKLYAFAGHLGGEQDVYGNPQKITINNIFLNFNKILNVETDGVLIRSDDSLQGLLPLFNKHNFMLIENDINMIMNGYNNRLQTMISASDDKTKASAEKYIENLIAGDIGVIGSSPMFEGVKSQSGGSQQGSAVTTLIEYHQYVKASLFNEIGLDANFNMKRERVTKGETEQGDDILYPFIDNMMKCRLAAIEKINEKYGLEITIDYGSVWNKKNKEMVDDIVTATGDAPDVTGDAMETPLDNPPTETGDAPDATPDATPDDEANEEATDETQDETLNETLDETTDETEGEIVLKSQPELEETTEISYGESSLPLSKESSNEKTEIEEMLKDETLTDEERETLLLMLSELEGV